MESRVVSIRLDADLHEEIKTIADKEMRSAAQQIVYFIEKGLERYYAEKDYLKGIDDKPNAEKTVG